MLPSWASSCGLYYKNMTIVNYTSSIVIKLKAFHTDDARVVIYNCHVFIVQATGVTSKTRLVSDCQVQTLQLIWPHCQQ